MRQQNSVILFSLLQLLQIKSDPYAKILENPYSKPLFQLESKFKGVYFLYQTLYGYYLSI